MISLAGRSPNQVAHELTGRDYLSFSAISTFQQCPLRFYFRYVAGLPETTVSANLVLGGAGHATVGHHFRELRGGTPPPPLSSLMDAYHAAWRERDGEQIQFNKRDDRHTLDELAQRLFVSFQASDISRPRGTILGIE